VESDWLSIILEKSISFFFPFLSFSKAPATNRRTFDKVDRSTKCSMIGVCNNENEGEITNPICDGFGDSADFCGVAWKIFLALMMKLLGVFLFGSFSGRRYLEKMPSL